MNISLLLRFCFIFFFAIISYRIESKQLAVDSSISLLDTQEALELPYNYNSVNVISGSYIEARSDLSISGFQLRRCYQSE